MTQVHGANWNAADTLARSLVSEDPFASYIPPYDHPLLWEGHSSIIDEIKDSGIKPSECPQRIERERYPWWG